MHQHQQYGRRFQQQSRKLTNFNCDHRSNGLTMEDFIKNCQSYKPQKKKIDKYVFAFQDFIGKGNFANVYKGINTHSNEPVAIKVMEMKSITQKKLYCLLQAEMEIFKSLRHNNILKCYDVLVTDNNCYVISQYCEQGDLQSFFKKSRIKFLNNDQNEEYQADELVESIVFDIYQGLLYLERKSIIHRDIKMSNILVRDGTAKIADFGFASFSKNNFQDVTVGSPAYMSPQALIHGIYGPKTDVWAFGILLYQIFHGKTPFDHCKSSIQLIQKLKIPFNRQEIQEKLPQKLKNLIAKCLSSNQDQRPTFRQLWMDEYIWELRNKFRPLLKTKQKQSALKLDNTKFVSAITNCSTLCTETTQYAEIEQPKQQKHDNKKNFDQEMEQFYKLAEEMNKRQQFQSQKKKKNIKKNQQQQIKQNISEGLLNLTQNSLFEGKQNSKCKISTQQKLKNQEQDIDIKNFQHIQNQYQYVLIVQKTVNFKLVLYFLQLYRLLNKLIINLVNISVDFSELIQKDQKDHLEQFSDKFSQKNLLNQDSFYSSALQEIVCFLYKKQALIVNESKKDQVLPWDFKQDKIQQNPYKRLKKFKIQNVIHYASIILKEISLKIQQKNIKYDIQAESWLKQKKLLSLIAQYSQNLEIQIQKFQEKKLQFQSYVKKQRKSFIDSRKKIKSERSICQKSQQSSSSKSKNSKKQQKKDKDINDYSFNLKEIAQTFLQLLKKIQVPLTQFSDAQSQSISQNESQLAQIQIKNQDLEQQKNIQQNEQSGLNYISKLSTIGNILALIYIQSKKIYNLNFSHETFPASSNNNLKIKKIEEFSSQIIKNNQKEIQDFLLLDSKQISSLDMFFQYMYEIQLQMLHQKQSQDELSKH